MFRSICFALWVSSLSATGRRPASGCFFASRLGFRGRGVRRFAPDPPSSTCQVNLEGQPRQQREWQGAGRRHKIRESKSEQSKREEIESRERENNRRGDAKDEQGKGGRGRGAEELRRGRQRRASGKGSSGCGVSAWGVGGEAGGSELWRGGSGRDVPRPRPARWPPAAGAWAEPAGSGRGRPPHPLAPDPRTAPAPRQAGGQGRRCGSLAVGLACGRLDGAENRVAHRPVGGPWKATRARTSGGRRRTRWRRRAGGRTSASS